MPDAERVLSAADSELQRSARELQQSCNRAATERVLSAADYGGVASTILRVIFSTEHTGLVEQAASALREVLNLFALLVQTYKILTGGERAAAVYRRTPPTTRSVFVLLYQ